MAPQGLQAYLVCVGDEMQGERGGSWEVGGNRLRRLHAYVLCCTLQEAVREQSVCLVQGTYTPVAPNIYLLLAYSQLSTHQPSSLVSQLTFLTGGAQRPVLLPE